jgi:solute carrier family 25 citrate transporter 1
MLTSRTKLIQDAASARPMYTNMVNGTIGICRVEGIAGIYRGLWPTVRQRLLPISIAPDHNGVSSWFWECGADAQIMKQGANSAVRFSSYAALQQVAIDYTKPASGKLGSTMTFGTGAVAGLITVCE